MPGSVELNKGHTSVPETEINQNILLLHVEHI